MTETHPNLSTRRLRLPLRLALVLVAMMAVAGCKGATPIKQILDDPARFGSEKVRIEGNVTESVGLLGSGIYEVDDGTGKIAVVSKDGGGVPRQGARVGVEGTVKPAFTVGSSRSPSSWKCGASHPSWRTHPRRQPCRRPHPPRFALCMKPDRASGSTSSGAGCSTRASWPR